MIYVPDTNAWIRFLNPGDTCVKARFLAVDQPRLHFCSIVKAELYFGAEKSSRKTDNQNVLRNLFADINSLPFDDDAARHYGVIRALLHRTGMPIGPNDLMIAAIVLAHDAVLVTHNTGEFSRIPDLKLEDWEV